MIPKIEKILYATGLGPNAPKVFGYAVTLAKNHGAKISILHALEPLSATGKAMIEACLSNEQLKELKKSGQSSLLSNIRERLENFCAEESLKLECCESLIEGTLVVEGRAEEMILREAEKLGADVIVMGTHRHSSLEELFLGSAAHSVMLRSKIPVLLVRID